MLNDVWVLNSEIDEDITRLKTIAVGILSDSGFNGPPLSEDLIHEMVRFGGAELHAVAAFIGGVASQEVIKVCVYTKFSIVYFETCFNQILSWFSFSAHH